MLAKLEPIFDLFIEHHIENIRLKTNCRSTATRYFLPFFPPRDLEYNSPTLAIHYTSTGVGAHIMMTSNAAEQVLRNDAPSDLFSFLNSEYGCLDQHFFSQLTAEDIARLRMTCHAARVHPKLARAQNQKSNDPILINENRMMIVKDRKLFVIGHNSCGALGLGNSQKQKTLIEHPFFQDKTIQDIQLADFHTLILADGTLFVMGSNRHGELGLGDVEEQSVPIEHPFFRGKHIDSIHAHNERSLVCADGKLFIMGCGNEGQLGLDQIRKQKTPIEHPFFIGMRIDKIQMFNCHTFIIANSKLYVMGFDSHGVLGLDNVFMQCTPIEHPVFKGMRIEQFYANEYQTFIIANGKLFVSGHNMFGELGLGDIGDKEGQSTFVEHPFFNNKRVESIHIGSQSTFILADGTLFVMGSNMDGQLGLGDTDELPVPIEHPFFHGKRIESIHVGFANALIQAEGKLFVMGANYGGSLGLGDIPKQSTPIEHPFFQGKRIESIHTAHHHTVIRADSRLFMMGSNNDSVLEFIFDEQEEKHRLPFELPKFRFQRPAITSPLILPRIDDSLTIQGKRVLAELLQTYESRRGFFRRHFPGIPATTRTIQDFTGLLHSGRDVTREAIVEILKNRDKRQSKTRKSRLISSVTFFQERNFESPKNLSATDQVIEGLKDHFVAH